MKPDFLILCATHLEISHFLTLCPGTSKRLTKNGHTVISGKVGEKTYDLMISGPGVFNAACALTAYLELTSPAMVLHAGIAGIFKDTGMGIGDVAIATEERYLHTGVQAESLENDPLPFDLIANDFSSRKGIYSFEKSLVDQYYDKLSHRFLNCNFNVEKGLFLTVSSITSSFERAAQLFNAFSPVMEAMEGSACAHAAKLYSCPMIEIRSASNFVGERNKSNWDMELAVKQLGAACASI